MKEVLIDKNKIFIYGLIIPVIFGFLFYWIKQYMNTGTIRINYLWSLPQDFSSSAIVIYLMIMTIAHELLHGVAFRLFCRVPWKNIKFGVLWKYLSPYCGCPGINFTKTAYISTLLFPNILITGVMMIYAFHILTYPYWAFIAGITVGVGAGDYLMAVEVLKYPSTAYFQDHPAEPGFFVVN